MDAVEEHSVFSEPLMIMMSWVFLEGGGGVGVITAINPRSVRECG